METPIQKKRGSPERIIQDGIITMLRGKGWAVEETHGNIYQCGFPDLFAAYKQVGQRWIEVKNPLSWKLTPAQRLWIPQFSAQGVGVWVLTGYSENDYKKLLQPPNWMEFFHKDWYR